MLYYRKKNVFKTLAAGIVRSFALTLIFIGVCFSINRSIEATPVSPSVFPVQEICSYLPEDDKLFSEPACGTLTSPFGERWGRTHTGIDIGGSLGDDILAADDGEVIFSGWMDGYGNYIVLDHKNGFKTAYAHLDETLVSRNEQVSKGQKIACMGSTGNSTGVHLHFEVKLDDEYQDPLNYVIY